MGTTDSKLMRVRVPVSSRFANRCACFAAFTGLGLSLGAAQAPTPTAPGYTLHTGTRIVLTDVTVQDRHGDPIHGLNRSAFRIFDDGRPQKLTSFEEHTGAPLSAPAAMGERFTNGYLLHPAVVSNVLFVDTVTLSMVDQMVLAQGLTRFVDELPRGESLAIYGRDGMLPILLQDFTSDHALLLAAVQRAVPHFRQFEAQYATDLDALKQLEQALQNLPGRKNLLWFSGGSNLFLTPDPATLPQSFDMRPMYDELEASRIAVYPIDARGLTVATGRAQPQQHMLMEDIAQATGGEAAFNENRMAAVASRLIQDGESFYTLTYSPHELHFDNKWHKVKVEVEGNAYQLSYRRGYFDDGNNLTSPATPGRTLLRAGGRTAPLPAARTEPIIFRADVVPAAESEPDSSAAVNHMPPLPPPRKNEVTYNIEFHLPANSFSHPAMQGRQQARVGTAILVTNRFGDSVGTMTRLITVVLDDQKLLAYPNGMMDFDEKINLPKGQDYLNMVVWDTATGRSGTVHVPLDVKQRK